MKEWTKYYNLACAQQQNLGLCILKMYVLINLLSITKINADLFVTGVNSLSQSLSANQLLATTLTHLDLSGNVLRGDDLSVGALFSNF